MGHQVNPGVSAGPPRCNKKTSTGKWGKALAHLCGGMSSLRRIGSKAPALTALKIGES